ncbi:MAG TPA: MFS transporter [Aliidongia sp.]|uniref:MFS transporter n=1 Tax=Aliidongia sp. TaxID=1914230 RepID=UPI002DDD5568|nr:MFS transporter [Aliidongia sp.]HEV2676561.1 MFS transporter [Aliidongia sp.]
MSRRGVGRWDGAILAFGATVVVASEFIVIGLAPPMAQSFALTLEQAGWFVTSFALGSAMLGPFAALAARSLRADRAMLGALLPFSAAMLVPLFGQAWCFCLLRVVQGAALPLFISVAGDTLGRVWGNDARATARLYLGVVFGSMFAAPAGAALADLVGWQPCFELLGAVTLLAMIGILIRKPLRVRPVSGNGLRDDVALLASPAVRRHLLVSLAHFAAMFCTYAFLAGILQQDGVAAHATGGWLLLFGLAGAVGNIAAGRLSAEKTRVGAVFTITVLSLASLALPWLGSAPFLLPAVLCAWGAAHSASFVICQLRVTRSAPAAPRLAAALNISAANFGIAGGSMAGGQALAAGGLPGLSAAGLALCAVTLALALGAPYRTAASSA